MTPGCWWRRQRCCRVVGGGDSVSVASSVAETVLVLRGEWQKQHRRHVVGGRDSIGIALVPCCGWPSLPPHVAAALPAVLPLLLPPSPMPCCRRQCRIAAVLPNVLLLPMTSRFCQAAASADKLAATAAATLPPPRYRYLHHRSAANASNACLYRHCGGARWQHGSGGSCRGHARRHRAANALPAAPAAAALPAFLRASSFCHR